MSSERQQYLISYDVCDPRRLRRTAKTLLGYGHRIQKSVFRCRITPRQLERLRWELVSILADEDELLIVSLCDHCASKVRVKGPTEKQRFDERQHGEEVTCHATASATDEAGRRSARGGRPSGAERKGGRTRTWDAIGPSFVIH